ncbi:type VI secretion system membrane subunit TssM [Comamonas sp. GB3 AK4-5]|uniref:type VI secretion system membrane subunit TssM n=1 Tax=Comamonas sp. GB3 AK4-5 TaxID=3231487 RepID=UPI00351F4B01
MHRVLRFLSDPRTLSVIGVVALTIFLLLGARTLEIRLLYAVGALAVVLAVGALVWLLRRWRARAAEKQLSAALEVQADKAVHSSADPARKAELDELRSRLSQAIKTIKTSKLGHLSGSRALYELPWYMVIGNPAAGKSSAVLHSGLQFPFAEKGSSVVQGVGGTRNCDWFFTTEGILLDTAGRYSVHEEDRSEWFGFLDLLKRHRPKAPINGIVVTASIPELMNARPDVAINLAKSLRQRVQELTERLEIFAPVYVMFTKADLITGFTQFFGDSEKLERDRVWGATLPYDPQEKSDPMAQFDVRFDELYAGLKEMSVAKVSMARGGKASPEVLAFPLEFAATKPALRAFLSTLFEVNPFQYKPVFRGFYFTSALQEGTVRSVSTERIATRFGLQLRSRPEADRDIQSQNGFFLRDLFSKVIFADKGTVRQFAHPFKTRLRYVAFFGFVLALGLLLGGWTWSYMGNQQLLANVQSDLEKAVKVQQAQSGLQARFEALGILQDRIEQLAKFRVDRPLSLSLGLYQGDYMEDRLLTEYYAGLQQILLAPVAANIEEFLRSADAYSELPPPSRPEGGATSEAAQATARVPQTGQLYAGSSPSNSQDVYNALKTYLMLGDKRHVETAHLTDQLSRFWRGWLETNRGEMPRDQMIRDAERTLSFYLSRVGDDTWPTLRASNLLLVDQTREKLRKVVRGMPARERVYGEIKARAATRFAPMTVPRILGAESGPGLIAGSYVISGAFTREAWEQYVDKAIRDAATQASSSTDWVLNVAASDDLTLEGSPEQIRKLLVGMYKQEYTKEWQQFLQGVAIREMSGFEQAVVAMNNLGDPQNSSIRKLLATVYEQTSWDNPVLINAGLKKVSPGFMGWLKGLWSRSTPVSVEPPIGGDGQAAQLPVGPVGREFAGVARIMVDRDGTTLLKGYLDTLSKLRTRFNQIRNEGDPGPGARQLMLQTIEGNGSELAAALKYVDEQVLTGMDGAQRQVLRPLLVRPLLQAYAVVMKPASVELNKVWDAQVYQLFQHTLASKYPFDASAKVEASAAEIGQVFGPEGAISKYVTNTLGPLVVRRGDLLSPKVWGEEGLRLKQELVAGFSAWVAPLAGGAASAGAPHQTLFQIQPRPSPGVTEYSIDIDGQQLRYRNTPAQWSNFAWPNPQGTPGAKVVATAFDGRSVELVNEPGNFGLERLVNTAKRNRRPDGSFELIWSRDGVAVSVLLRIIQSPQSATQGGDSPQGNRLRNLALPKAAVDVPTAGAAPAAAASAPMPAPAAGGSL